MSINEILGEILAFISVILFWFKDNLLIIQLISFVVSLILIGYILYYVPRISFVGDRLEHFIDVLGQKDISRRRSVKAWNQIKKRLKIGDQTNLKLAIIESDKILDEILKRAGFLGKDMDERLAQITSAQISNIKEATEAHKLKQRLFSEPDFPLTQEEADVAVKIYEETFKELKLIS